MSRPGPVLSRVSGAPVLSVGTDWVSHQKLARTLRCGIVRKCNGHPERYSYFVTIFVGISLIDFSVKDLTILGGYLCLTMSRSSRAFPPMDSSVFRTRVSGEIFRPVAS